MVVQKVKFLDPKTELEKEEGNNYILFKSHLALQKKNFAFNLFFHTPRLVCKYKKNLS